MTDPSLFPSLAPGTKHKRVKGGCSCGWEFTAVEVGGHWFNMTVCVGGEEMNGFDAHMLIVENPGEHWHRNMTIEDQRAIAMRIHGPSLETGG